MRKGSSRIPASKQGWKPCRRFDQMLWPSSYILYEWCTTTISLYGRMGCACCCCWCCCVCCVRACVHVCVCECVWVLTCVHVCVIVCVGACVHACMSVWVHVCMCACVCIFVCGGRGELTWSAETWFGAQLARDRERQESMASCNCHTPSSNVTLCTSIVFWTLPNVLNGQGVKRRRRRCVGAHVQSIL